MQPGCNFTRNLSLLKQVRIGTGKGSWCKLCIALDATATPARMSFRAEWKATNERVTYNDPQKHYRVEGYRALVQVEARVEVPALAFSWKSDPLTTSRAAFGIIGEEANGKYYDTP